MIGGGDVTDDIVNFLTLTSTKTIHASKTKQIAEKIKQTFVDTKYPENEIIDELTKMSKDKGELGLDQYLKAIERKMEEQLRFGPPGKSRLVVPSFIRQKDGSGPWEIKTNNNDIWTTLVQESECPTYHGAYFVSDDGTVIEGFHDVYYVILSEDVAGENLMKFTVGSTIKRITLYKEYKKGTVLILIDTEDGQHLTYIHEIKAEVWARTSGHSGDPTRHPLVKNKNVKLLSKP